MCLAGARRTISRGRESEREGAVDSIDLPSVLRRWKCVLNVVGTESRERERFLQVVVAGDGDDRETTDIPFEKGTIGILTIVSLVCRCSSRFSLLRIYFRMDVEKKETRNWANVNISDKFF